MHRFLEAFFRHKLLLIAPVVLSLAVSVWYVRSQPVRYQSSMALWFDTAAPNASSIAAAPQGATPANQAQGVLQELLGTRQFLVDIGHRGPLAQYLSTHQSTKHGLSELIAKLKSLFRSSSGTAPVDDQIAGSLGHAFASFTTGPQILRVTMTGSAPGPMPGTLKALASVYADQVTTVQKQRDQASVDYYRTLLTGAQQAVNRADSDVVSYQEAHPGATAVTDLTLEQLVQLALTEHNNFNQVQESYGQAALALANAQSPTGVLSIIDPPLSVSPVSHKKKEIFAGVAGLFLGAVISILVTTALVATDKTAREEEDLQEVEGLEVVAQIGHLRTARRSHDQPRDDELVSRPS